MITLIKLLKIVLPVATVTTATIFTTSLISFSKKESEKDSENKDKILDDIEVRAENFKEKKMLYSKDGKGKSITLDDENLNNELIEKLRQNPDLIEGPEFKGKLPDEEQLKEILDKVKNKPLPSNDGSQNPKEVSRDEKPDQGVSQSTKSQPVQSHSNSGDQEINGSGSIISENESKLSKTIQNGDVSDLGRGKDQEPTKEGLSSGVLKDKQDIDDPEKLDEKEGGSLSTISNLEKCGQENDLNEAQKTEEIGRSKNQDLQQIQETKGDFESSSSNLETGSNILSEKGTTASDSLDTDNNVSSFNDSSLGVPAVETSKTRNDISDSKVDSGLSAGKNRLSPEDIQALQDLEQTILSTTNELLALSN